MCCEWLHFIYHVLSFPLCIPLRKCLEIKLFSSINVLWWMITQPVSAHFNVQHVIGNMKGVCINSNDRLQLLLLPPHRIFMRLLNRHVFTWERKEIGFKISRFSELQEQTTIGRNTGWTQLGQRQSASLGSRIDESEGGLAAWCRFVTALLSGQNGWKG